MSAVQSESGMHITCAYVTCLLHPDPYPCTRILCLRNVNASLALSLISYACHLCERKISCNLFN
uniref:Uncharacterized protein n=1 Tax=Nelumbo nucifera TaxID=4432 RepID=A0A822XG78_NELNU|nr:TPA_asm: hypothetical protein HUJ06_020156 [Nelumbo nucifera]